jgi:hypothetical protein
MILFLVPVSGCFLIGLVLVGILDCLWDSSSERRARVFWPMTDPHRKKKGAFDRGALSIFLLGGGLLAFWALFL